MTPYLTKVEYRALGGDIPMTVSDAVLEKYILLASIKLLAVCANRIVVEDLTDFQLSQLKIATQIEADYLYSVKIQGFTGDVSSWSMPDVSISYNAPTGSAKWYKENDIDLTAVLLLNSSGLAWRGGI